MKVKVNIDNLLDNLDEKGYCCSITYELMYDPHTTPCGHTFENEALTRWLTKQKTCPCCKQPVSSANPPLKNNYLRKQISQACQENPELYSKRYYTKTSMLNAVKNRPEEAVNMLRKEKINEPLDNNGRTALLWLAKTDNLPGAIEALALGAKLNQTCHNNFSAVMYAAANGCIEILNLLLDQENIDLFQAATSQKQNGYTALHLAAFYGDIEACRALINASAPLNAEANNKTPEQLAIHAVKDVFKEPQNILNLIKRRIRDKAMDAAIRLLAKNEDSIQLFAKPVFKHMLEQYTLKPFFVKALILAIIKVKNAALLNHSLEALKFNINESLDDLGQTALLWFAKNNDLNGVKQALALGAEPNKTNYEGVSALHVSAAIGNIDVLKLLLSQSKNVNLSQSSTYNGHQDYTALHLAAYYNHPTCCRLLITAGAPIDTPERHGKTAEEIAAYEAKTVFNEFPAILALIKVKMRNKAMDSAANIITENISRFKNQDLMQHIVNHIKTCYSKKTDFIDAFSIAIIKKNNPSALTSLIENNYLPQAKTFPTLLALINKKISLNAMNEVIDLISKNKSHFKNIDLTQVVITHIIRCYPNQTNVTASFASAALKLSNFNVLTYMVQNDCLTQSVLTHIKKLHSSLDKNFIKPALLFFAKLGKTDIYLKIINKWGFNINTPLDNNGLVVLHYLTIQNNSKGIKRALALGANINQPDNLGRVALIFAAHDDRLDVLRFLLKQKGIELAPKSSPGTPLHYAASFGQPESCRLLIKAGASIYVVNRQGISPKQAATGEAKRVFLPRSLASIRANKQKKQIFNPQSTEVRLFEQSTSSSIIQMQEPPSRQNPAPVVQHLRR